MPCFPRSLGAFAVAVPAMVFVVVAVPQDSPAPLCAQEVVKALRPSVHEETHLRRPVAVALADSGPLLLTANRESGTISVVDVPAGKVVSETRVGRRLSDLAIMPGGGHVIAIDELDHELIVVRRPGRSWRGQRLSMFPETSIQVAPYPVQVRLNAAGTRAYVTSLWSQQLTIVKIEPSRPGEVPRIDLAVAAKIDLPFSPRMQILVRDDTKLIVADAFGGKLAVLDAASGKLLHVRELPAHNIRGLAVSASGRKLLVSHQILNDLAETTQNDVHWGVLMTNMLRWVELDRVLSPDAELIDDNLLKGSHVHLAGDTSDAGGDPAAVAVAKNGMAVVALGGVNQVGLGLEKDYRLDRFRTGRRPTAVAISSDGSRAYLANTLSDSITVVDLEKRALAGEISLGPQPELSLAQRGEVLFYNARLSLDGWFSCHSCHTDGHTNGQMNDNLGDESFGAAKKVLSLLGVSETAPYAWTGKMPDLKSQIRKSIRTTMQGRERADEEVEALAAFMETLRPPPPLDVARGTLDAATVERGKALFEKLDCASCHRGPTFTSDESFDVGLVDKKGNRQFNPPSLRGVSQRAPYFHDNSAATLEEVFSKHRHMLPEGRVVEEKELSDLVGYLRSL
ncbi:MAG: c-type cytochrome [Planctomycetia bacterium]|nr:c-type cytochrome [Planctomycetia bacterium]